MKQTSSRIVQALALLLIGSGALTLNLQAQTDSSETVTIQFPFRVGTQSIGPGTYQFSLVSSQFLLSVRNVKTGDREIFAARPERQPVSEQRGHLVFRNSAGRSVLNEVHFCGTDTYTELVPHDRARTIEAKSPVTSATVVVAQR